jgi:hypothetical protein
MAVLCGSAAVTWSSRDSAYSVLGVLPLHDKSELTSLQPPTASRPAHRYARTQRPLFGMSGRWQPLRAEIGRVCAGRERSVRQQLALYGGGNGAGTVLSALAPGYRGAGAVGSAGVLPGGIALACDGAR